MEIVERRHYPPVCPIHSTSISAKEGHRHLRLHQHQHLRLQRQRAADTNRVTALGRTLRHRMAWRQHGPISNTTRPRLQYGLSLAVYGLGYSLSQQNTAPSLTDGCRRRRWCRRCCLRHLSSYPPAASPLRSFRRPRPARWCRAATCPWSRAAGAPAGRPRWR